MRRIVLAGGAAMLLLSCSSAPRPNYGAEQHSANEAFFLCLVHAAAQMDDHQSDASTIALAIEPICARAFSAVEDTYARDAPNSAAAAMLRQRMDANELQQATGAVLAERGN